MSHMGMSLPLLVSLDTLEPFQVFSIPQACVAKKTSERRLWGPAESNLRGTKLPCSSQSAIDGKIKVDIFAGPNQATPSGTPSHFSKSCGDSH